jgi:hypothetical protein
LGFQEVEAPEFLDNQHMKVVRGYLIRCVDENQPVYSSRFVLSTAVRSKGEVRTELPVYEEINCTENR